MISHSSELFLFCAEANSLSLKGAASELGSKEADTSRSFASSALSSSDGPVLGPMWERVGWGCSQKISTVVDIFSSNA